MSNKQLEMMAREHDMTAIDAELAEKMAEATAEGVVTGYKKIEEAVVSGYKKLETGVVEGFGKVTDACVKTLFAKEGESVEEARARLERRDKK